VGWITNLFPKKYEKAIEWIRDIGIYILFIVLIYYSINTGCYQVVDINGNPIPDDEINEVLRRYAESRNEQSDFLMPDISNISYNQVSGDSD
jgi:hypothetical protein